MMRVDALRERLAKRELADAREVVERGGIPALIAFAREHVHRIEVSRARHETLAREVERHPEARDALIEAYLRETVTDERALRRDLRARARSGGELVDLATLGERVVRDAARAETAAEAALALARAALHVDHGPAGELAPLFELARTPGQWSRRTEALGLMGELARLGVGREGEPSIATVARALTARTEHRWVQPAALATLAACDPIGAVAILRERFASAERGDDLLVRERFVDLAARGVLGPNAWEQLVNLASSDPSEHVRLTVARGERNVLRLARLAQKDSSPRVRAAALIGLASHDAFEAELALARALRDDPHELPVRTAAEEIAAIARRDGITNRQAVVEALGRAAARPDIAAAVRARASEALAEVSVFCDPLARQAFEVLAPVVTATPVSSRTVVRDRFLESLDDARLGRVLTVLARDDFALGVDRVEGGIVLHRGEVRRFAPWRAWFELRNPSPSKRQAFDHTLGRRPAGALRAPPGGLAERTATRVPGERVVVERAGGWGRHLPLIDDLLSTGVLRRRPVSLVAASGTTTLTPPSSLVARARGWLSLTLRYTTYADMRRRALESDEPSTRVAFVNEVAARTGIAIRYAPHVFPAGEVPPAPRGLEPRVVSAPPREPSDSRVPNTALALLPALGAEWQGLSDLGRDLWQYTQSPHGNRLPHLAAYATVMLGAFLVRSVAVRRSIERDREAIPLVIGGWGTRGKSGTERLKAALFQGLGHECLVKTTGCEAMFIHAVPGQRAREIFIYRPYDKATVWEQRDVLALARALSVRVFLWECMALQPDLVALLQAQWMRDDYSTITNAYPDHEDVQGPSGYDVATVISEFVPTNGNLLTAEDQMLPLLRERSRERGTTMRVCHARDADLISEELLARFPYAEHPRNIALATQLARALGVPSAVALAEMADHVVPDLGVLKEFPRVPHRGRTLSFVNGMSANERTAAVGNWQRTGFATHDPTTRPGEWIVTVVNNRADRIARSQVFAHFLVEDVSAHRHVLIGTNVRGLRVFLEEALVKHLVDMSPTRGLEGDGTERLGVARARLERAFARLKIGALDVASLERELAVMGPLPVEREVLAGLLEPAEPGERYEAARNEVDDRLPRVEGETRRFVVAAIAKRRAVRAVHALLARDLARTPLEIDRAFARAYKAIFFDSVVIVDDPSASGDKILDTIAASVPPGVHARVMGVQNIKGTGLDFVYRWVSIDAVDKHLASLGSPLVARREEALRALALHGDYGLLDARNALARVEAAQRDDPHAGSLPYDVALARLREVVEQRERALKTKRRRSAGAVVRAVLGRTFDYLEATKRRKQATELLEALIEGRISHARAANRMREIVARAKVNPGTT